MLSPRFTETLLTVLAVSLGALILGLTFWSFGTDPMWAIISFVLVFDPDVRVALGAGVSRLACTVLGSAIAMAAVFSCGLHKWLMPVSLAATVLICSAFLRDRRSVRIVMVTVALIVGSSLLEASNGPYIAVTRSLEVSCGSLLAIAFSWLVARISPRGR